MSDLFTLNYIIVFCLCVTGEGGVLGLKARSMMAEGKALELVLCLAGLFVLGPVSVATRTDLSVKIRIFDTIRN